MNDFIKYNKNYLNISFNFAKHAFQYMDNVVSDSSSTIASIPSDFNAGASVNGAINNLKDVCMSVDYLDSSYINWGVLMDELESDPNQASLYGVEYAIVPTSDGFYKVFGIGGPMIVNAECAQYLQNAINAMLSICPGSFNNNGAKDGEGSYGHGTGHAFDFQTNLGIRINYNGGSDTVYYSVWNKKTERSAYDVFYVTYDGPLEEIFDKKKLTIKKPYLKIKPGTNIPPEMQKYVVNGLDNILEVDDVTRSHPSLKNMRFISLESQFLDVSKLFASYGFRQITSTGVKDGEGQYQSFEWHHFLFEPSLIEANKKPNPTTTPEVTPNPTPVPTATPKPSPNPKIPSPTAAPVTPTPNPTQTPKPNPSPAGGPTTSPSPTATPTTEIKSAWSSPMDEYNELRQEMFELKKIKKPTVIEEPVTEEPVVEDPYEDLGADPKPPVIDPDPTPDPKPPVADPTPDSKPPVTDPEPPTPPVIPEPTYILPENKFSEIIPNISGGTLGSMEISIEHVNYELSGITDEIYNNYINSIKEAGYSLGTDGIWISGNYTLNLVRNNTDLNIYFKLNE